MILNARDDIEEPLDQLKSFIREMRSRISFRNPIQVISIPKHLEVNRAMSGIDKGSETA